MGAASSSSTVLQNCEVCNDEIPLVNLSQHLHSHAGDYVLLCPNYASCGFASISPEHLEALHLRHNPFCLKKADLSIGPEGNFMKKCKICAFETEHYPVLRQHLRTTHSKCESSSSSSWPCPFPNCVSSYPVRQLTQLHLVSHIFEAPGTTQKCSVCHIRIDKDKVEAHLKIGHQIEEIFHCQICNQRFDSRLSFIDHFMDHKVNKGQDILPIYCDICQITGFSGVNALREHYFVEHQVGDQFECIYCDFTTVKKFKFAHHMRKKHGEIYAFSERQRAKLRASLNVILECEICFAGKRPIPFFNSDEKLNAHRIKVHRISQYKCSVCHQLFVNQTECLRHQKKMHGLRPVNKVEDVNQPVNAKGGISEMETSTAG